MGHRLEINQSDIKFPIVFFNHFFTKEKTVKLHFHEEIEIVYVVDGELEITVNQETKNYQSGEVFIINQGLLHSIIFKQENNHIYTYLLNTNVFSSYNINISNLVFNKPKNLDVFLQFSNYQIWTPLQKHIAMYQVYDELLKNSVRIENNKKKHSKINEVIAYVNAHYDEEMQLIDIAEHFNLHPNYLSRLFKKETSLSLHHYLQRVRMNHAYQDVLYTSDHLLDIAYQHGFTNIKSFNRLFKEIYGCTPSQYRKLKNDL